MGCSTRIVAEMPAVTPMYVPIERSRSLTVMTHSWASVANASGTARRNSRSRPKVLIERGWM